MTTRRRCLLLVFLFMVVPLLMASTEQASAADELALKVLSVIPSGDVPRIKQFTVTFNQPMVPLGDMDRTADQVPLQIKPAMPGKFRWLNVYTLAFEPATPLEGSQTGEIVVKSGIKALSGAILDKDVTATYALPRLSLVRSSPGADSGGLSLKPEITLVFNQPLDVDQLKSRAFFLTEQGLKIEVAIVDAVEINNRRKPGGEWKVVIQPTTDFSPNSSYELVIPSGLSSLVGPIVSENEAHLSFRTYGPLTVTTINSGYNDSDSTSYDPSGSINITFSNKVLVKDVFRVLKLSPEHDLKELTDYLDEEGDQEKTTHVWIPGPFKAETAYKLAFGTGLKDEYGQELSGQTTFEINFGPAQPLLSLVGREGVIEPSDRPTYPILVRNISKIKVRSRLLKPDEIIPFMKEKGMQEYFDDSDEDSLTGPWRRQMKTSQVEIKSPPNVASYQPIDLKKVIGQLGPGLIYFDVTSPELNELEGRRRYYRRALVQVSHIGLSVKFGQSNTLVWTTDLKSGEPLPGVALEIRDQSNRVLWQGKSDGQGLATAPGAEDFKLTHDEDTGLRPILYVLSQHKGRTSFISTTWNEGISPWNFGLPTRDLDAGTDILTWALTALPLYKPGEEVRFKIIQRQSNGQGMIAPKDKKKVYIQINDSLGKNIANLDLGLNRFGTASGRFAIPPAAPVGQYGIMVGETEKNLKFVGSFQVETYRKPTFAVKVEPSEMTGLVGDKIDVTVKANYHFGSPVKDQPVDYNVTASQADFSIPGYEEFTIQDWEGMPDQTEDQFPTVAQGKMDLDQQGLAKLDFTATPPKRLMPRHFQIEATVTDVDQRAVSQRQSVLIHPAAFYLGLKPDKTLVGSGEKLTVSLIAATPDGQLKPEVEAELILYRRVWQTVRRKGVGSMYEYLSKVQDTEIKRQKATTANIPVEVSFTMEQGGTYYLAAKASDSNGRPTLSAIGFYAYGPGPIGWAQYNHDRIDLVPDKKEYRPGDTAVIMVKSPFTQGTGLLTVERSGVKRQEIFKIENSSPTLKVKIEKDDSPNIFISVILVRGRISEELDKQGGDVGKPAFKVGYSELKIKDDSRKLKVTVGADRPQYRPGEEVELSLKVVDADGQPRVAEVAVIVADAALLQLTKEDVYYPERLFFSARPISVFTSDTRLNLIGRRHYGLKGANPGGGGLGAAGEKYRKKFLSLAFFEPHAVTDSSGQVKLRFKLPDNLTTFKIFAVAGDDREKFGTGINQFLVTTPLLIAPALPNFVGVGDQFMAAITVHNRTEAAGQATVTMTGENIEAPEPASRTIDLKAGESREVGFPVKAKSGKGAIFRYIITMGQEKDAAEFQVPIRFPNPMTTVATYGRLTASIQEKILLPAGTDTSRGGLTLVVSPSMIGSLTGAFDYLATYPHQCLEQKTSRAWGDFFLVYWRDRLAQEEATVKKARERIRNYLDGLPSFQNYNGGFSYWPGQEATKYPDPYLTAYVIEFMHYAKKGGFDIDTEVWNRGLRYLNDVLNQNRWPIWYGIEYRLTTTCYMMCVLAETGGNKIAAHLENQYNRRKEMSPFELALTLQTVKLIGDPKQSADQIKDLTDRLFSRAVVTSGEVHFEENTGLAGIMASLARTNAFVLRALLRTQSDSPHVVDLARWLVKERKNGHWGNTQSNAMVLLALSEYIKVLEKDPPNFNLKAFLADHKVAEADIKGYNTPSVIRDIPAKEFTPGTETPLDLKFTGSGSSYYTLTLKTAKIEPDLTSRQAGFSLMRTYSVLTPGSDQIKPVQTFKRGDIVRIDLTLLVPHQRHWVVLEDLLPAGLEPINFNLPVAPTYLQRQLDQGQSSEDYFRLYWYQHKEIRDDRVVLYARRLVEGVYTFTYLARVVTSGNFIAPGPQAEEMYTPEVQGRGEGLKIEVKAD